MNTLLWLDDYRNPLSEEWLVFSPLGDEYIPYKCHWVKSYNQFVKWILENGLPTGICFDHDLGDEKKTGYDCAKWLMNYCYVNKLPLPLYNIQSANPVGKENIDRSLKRFKEAHQFAR